MDEDDLQRISREDAMRFRESGVIEEIGVSGDSDGFDIIVEVTGDISINGQKLPQGWEMCYRGTNEDQERIDSILYGEEDEEV